MKLFTDTLAVKLPQARVEAKGRPTPYHQEHGALPYEGLGVNVWAALDDIEPAQGTMRFYNGSHKLGPLGEPEPHDVEALELALDRSAGEAIGVHLVARRAVRRLEDHRERLRPGLAPHGDRAVLARLDALSHRDLSDHARLDRIDGRDRAGEAALDVAEGIGANARRFSAGGRQARANQVRQIIAQRTGAGKLEVPVRVALVRLF